MIHITLNNYVACESLTRFLFFFILVYTNLIIVKNVLGILRLRLFNTFFVLFFERKAHV